VFYGDYFPGTPTALRRLDDLAATSKADGEVAPLVINVCNFAKAATPALALPPTTRSVPQSARPARIAANDLSLAGRDERFTDFVELPAAYEHWQEPGGATEVRAALQPASAAGRLLQRFSRTQIQPELSTVESSPRADRSRIHTPAEAGVPQCRRSNAELEKIEPSEIVMRHARRNSRHILAIICAATTAIMWSE